MIKRKSRIKKIKSKIRRYQLYTKAMSMLLTLVILFLAIPVNIYAEIAEAIPESKGEVINHADEESQATVQREIYEDISLREINTKHFRLPDGSYVAAQYPYAVHYVAEDGSLVDINNALSDVGGGMYANENARVKFSKKISGSAALFELKDGSTKLTLSLIGANKGTGGIVTNGTDAEEDTELQKMMNLEALSSTVLYPDALDGVDLEYIVSSLSIKENIIVKEQKESYSYSFELKLNGLTAELSESGDILIYDGDTAKYVIPSPVVYDASGAYAPKEASAYTLTGKGDGKYTLTVSVSAEWMNDGARVFPVTVDPTIDSAEYGLNVIITQINKDSPNWVISGAVAMKVYPDDAVYATLQSLPTIPANAYVNEAVFSLFMCDHLHEIQLGAKLVTTDWDSSLTYNRYLAGEGARESVYQDIILLPDDPYTGWDEETGIVELEFDITDAYIRWKNNTDDMFGIALELVHGSGYTPDSYASLYTGNDGIHFPQFAVSYRIIDGVEDYWPTISQSAGLAGAGVVNLATGALNFSIPLMSTTAPLMTFTPTLVYNSSMAGKLYGAQESYTSYTDARAPFGMMLNISETIKVIPYGENNAYAMMLYLDGDGTPHYFSGYADSSIFWDEDGLGLELTRSDNEVRIEDQDKNSRIFSKMGSNSNWYLSSIEDRIGNAIIFNVDNLYRVTSISLEPLGVSTPIEMLTFTYNGDGLLSMVLNPTTNEATVLKYSNDISSAIANSGFFLRRVEYARGNESTSSLEWNAFANNGATNVGISVIGSAEYMYNTDATLLVGMDSLSHLAIRYIYDNSQRIAGAFENYSLSQLYPGQILRIYYGISYTDVQIDGNDDTSGTSDDIITKYCIDDYGRMTSAYSYRRGGREIYGAVYGNYATQEKSKNNLESLTVTGGASVNYLLDGDFSDFLTDKPARWNISGIGISRNAYSIDQSLYNGYSVKISPPAGETASISQSTRLLNGDYTISFPYISYYGNCGSIYVKIILPDGSIQHSEKVNLNATSNGIHSFFSTTFHIDSAVIADVVIEVSTTAGASPALSFQIDNVMLERGIGASDFSFIECGSFLSDDAEVVADYWEAVGMSGINISNSTTLFESTLRIHASITEASAKQRVFEAKESDLASLAINNVGEQYILSGYACATDAILSGNSPFRLRVDIGYYQGEGVEDVIFTQFVDFVPGIKTWQFASGTINTMPSELKPGVRYEIIRYIDVYAEYYRQCGGSAQFDNISLVRASDKTLLCKYNLAGSVTEISRYNEYQYYVYDVDNNVIRSANSDGTVIDYTYTSDGLVNTETVSQVSVAGYYSYSDFSSNTVPLNYKNRTTYDYNDYGLPSVTEIVALNSNGSTNTAIPSVRQEYHYNTVATSKIFGAMTKEVDSAGATICYYYDADNGDLLANINITSGHGTAYSYDSMHRLADISPAISINEYSYSVNINGESINYVYNNANYLSGIQSNSADYSFTYDDFGNMTSICLDGRIIASFAYNPNNGKLIAMANVYEDLWTYKYNDLEFLSEVWYTEYGRETMQLYEYEYTASGKVHKYTDYTSNRVTVYKYDSRDRVVNVSEYDLDDYLHDYSATVSYTDEGWINSWLGDLDYKQYNSSTGVYTVNTQSIDYRYIYRTDGSIQQQRYSIGNGNILNALYYYDSYDRPMYNTYAYSSGTSFSRREDFTYETKSVGENAYSSSRVETYTSTMNGVATTYTYGYDARGYIISVTISSPGSQAYSIYYTYDDIGQLVREDNEQLGLTIYYIYDESGNIVEKQVGPYTRGTLAPDYSTLYSYNSSISGDVMTGVDSASITYTLDGYPLQYRNDSAEYQFIWLDGSLSLATVRGNRYYYTYDSNGLRRTKTFNGLTTTYYYESDRLISEQNDNETIIYIYDAYGSVIGMQYRLSTYAKGVYDVYWFEKNLFGDVTAVWSDDGVKLITYKYEAFGYFSTSYHNGGGSTTATKNSMTYRGYYFDSDLQLYYLNARYYDSTTCRFISPDDLSYLGANGDLLSYNLYAYCSNNPIMFTDPSGHATYGVSLNADATFFYLGISLSIALVWDDDRNLAVQFSYAMPNVMCDGSTSYHGLVDAGVSIGLQRTDDDTIYDLEGTASYIGASASVCGPLFIGGDVIFSGTNIVQDASNNKYDSKASGGAVYFGYGFGYDVHVRVTQTTTLLHILKGRKL